MSFEPIEKILGFTDVPLVYGSALGLGMIDTDLGRLALIATIFYTIVKTYIEIKKYLRKK